MNRRKLKKGGYIALISVSIIMVVLIIFLTSAQFIISSGLQGGLTDRLSIEAYSVAETCFDDALILLRSNSSYVGGSLNVADGYCIIVLTDSGPNTKNIQVEGSTLNTYFQTIEAEIEIIETSDTKQIIILSKNRY
ncbi:hypothetical protein KKG71_06460 [Patescibacteria group bacterium]|nr:hypothetical protein [Patescibacteria group bacterium]